MKSILLLTFVVFSNGEKLDKTYLPPASAQSAGGSSLETPKSTPGLVDGISGQYNYAGNYGEYNAGILGLYGIGGINGQYNNAGVLGQYGIGGKNEQYNNAGVLGLYGIGGIYGQYNNAGVLGQYGIGEKNEQYNNAGVLGQYGIGGKNGQYNNAGQYGIGGINGQYNNAGVLGQYGIGGINGQYNNARILGQYNTGSFQQPISNFNNYNSFAANYRPERPQAVFERNAAILRYDNVNNVDNYAYRYETSNGITAEETGIATNGVVAQGGFSYLGDDGRQYTVRYTADENGFRPVGDHLPTPPPIPEAILRSLEQNARDEAAGIFDDGSYNENLYGDKRGYNHGYKYPAANLANLRAIKNIQAQAINLLEQAKQAEAINNAVQANIQAQAISQLEQAKQAPAINLAAQGNIQTQAINHAAQAKQAQPIKNLVKAKSTAGSRAYLPPKGH